MVQFYLILDSPVVYLSYLIFKYIALFYSAGSLCNCLLPEAHQITAVQHDPDSQSEDGEKQRLRSAFSCLFSISMRQRQFCTSSLLLTSPSRGCLSLPELRSGTIALKDYRKLLELVYDEQFDSF